MSDIEEDMEMTTAAAESAWNDTLPKETCEAILRVVAACRKMRDRISFFTSLSDYLLRELDETGEPGYSSVIELLAKRCHQDKYYEWLTENDICKPEELIP